jgi:hypothetical protein
VVFDELGYEVEIVVVGDFVPDHFSAFFAAVEDLEALFLALVNVDRFHQAQAGACAVARGALIHVQGIEAVPAVVPAAFFGFRIGFLAFFADERFVAVDRVGAGLSFHGFYGIIIR